MVIFFPNPCFSVSVRCLATNAELWRMSKERKCRPTSLEAHASVSLCYKSFRCSEGTIHSIPPPPHPLILSAFYYYSPSDRLASLMSQS